MSITIEVTQDGNTSSINLLYHLGDVDSFKECVCQEFELDPQEQDLDVDELFDSIKDGLIFEDLDSGELHDFNDIESFLEHSFNNDEEGEAFWKYIKHISGEFSDRTSFNDAYCGTHSDVEEFAKYQYQDTDIPDTLLWCVDWFKYWEINLSMDHFTIDIENSGVAGFRNV